MAGPWDQYAAAEPAQLPIRPWEAYRVPESSKTEAFGAASVRQHFQPYSAKAAESFEDYLKAGFQQSVTGLAARGKAPDVALTEDTPWYGRIASNIAGIAGDLPAMIPGFIAGAPVGAAAGSAVPVVGTAAGGVMGGFAGATALPAGLRSAMMEAYTKGSVTSSSDFISRALAVAWETAKGGMVGAATGGAGVAAKAVLPVAAGAVTKAIAPTAAQIVTMTTVGKGLEGQLPEPRDFVDAAIVIGGMQAAGHVAGKLRTIYAKTGIPPEQVAADAAQSAELKAELVAKITGPEQFELPGIPKAYQVAAQDEMAHSIVPGEKAAKVSASPFALELPQAAGEPAKPTHVNYNYINTAEDTKLALARLSQVYEQDIQTQRRGTVSWEQTSNETAKILADTLGGADTRLLMPREPGTAAGAAEILARKQLVVGAAESMMEARDNLLALGEKATQGDQLLFLQAIERTAMIQSEFLGARAEAGRALNILKSTAIEVERIKQIQDVINMFGKDPMTLASMLKEIDNPAGALKFAREAVKATMWEKLVEAWKAGILSGPVTHIANIMGNTTFASLRVPIDALASGIGMLRGAAVGQRISAFEPLARVVGILEGTKDGLKIGGAMMLREDATVGKAESFKHAIEGTKGQVIRLSFRALGAEDAVFKTMNERGEAASLATRQAMTEGLNPLTKEFRERIAQLVQNPTPEMAKKIDEAGARFTFNTQMGEKGQAVQTFVRKWHLEFMVPFIRTPGNIAKELLRMTPFALLVKEWRTAIAEGGIARDRAISEITLGTGVMSITVAHALEGSISGAGSPDPGKRKVQLAAGWQPYSIKVGDTWYNYQRLQPLGTLIGMAADMAEVWDHMTEEESDKTPKMIAVAFGNAITNQTFLQGITNIVNAMSDPTRFGPKLIQQFVGSAVPNIIAQPTAMYDPVVREVNSVLDAVKARIPGARQSLFPKRDIYGEPIETKARLGGVSPITETKETTDKVRAEAARLGISAADTPKKVHIGRGSGKIGDVKLEPDERDRFSEIGGKLAHELLTEIVNTPGYDDAPDLIKKRTFAKVFTMAHKAGAAQALSPEKREAMITEIMEKMDIELQPAETQ